MKTGNRIEEGKLIAEFMGWKFHNDDKQTYPDGYYHYETDDEICWEQPKDMQYHSSWDWLMPVVEKIFLLRQVQDIVIKLGVVRIELVDAPHIVSPHKPENTPLEELWSAVVQFILWYNQKK